MPHDVSVPTPEELDAYEFEPGDLCPFCELTPQWERTGLHWHAHWRAVGWPEYIATPLLFAAAFAIEPLSPEATEASWTGPILFDGAVRDALVAKSQAGQDRTALASDVLFYTSVAYPVVIDNLIVTWGARQSPRVAWQLFVINAQSYAIASAMNYATKRATSRQRPWGERCPDDAPGHDCDSPNRYRSFYSGHATITATGAGLTCAHHTQLSLYKNPALDTTACLAAVGFTAATGVLRMSSDNHWASDVITGHFMGYLAGYLFPTLMYYREFRISPRPHHEHGEPPPQGPVWAVLPIVQEGSFQLMGVGAF